MFSSISRRKSVSILISANWSRGRSRFVSIGCTGRALLVSEAEGGVTPKIDLANDVMGGRGDVAGEDRKEVRDVI